MPFTKADVEKHNKGLSSKQKDQWVAVANSVLKRCMDNGGSESTCAASAIRQANGVVANTQNYNAHKSTVSEYEVRTATFEGKEYWVVPVVMMVEGVHNGNMGPLLHTINELGKFPGSWDGIPVMIDHPQEDGHSVSANSPEILEKWKVGQVFNTHVDGKKLKAEAWLEKNKLLNVSPEAYNVINEKKPLEVSVGVFSEEDDTPGIYGNEEYTASAFNHRPDHLALLPGGVGACSLEDGCGVRTNKKGGNTEMNENATVTGMEKKRQDLGMTVSEFYAVPRDPPSESKLPIFDAAHVRNALARFNQVQGLTAEEKATAKRKILAKAREFGIDAASLVENMQGDIFSALQSAKEVGMYFDKFNSNLERSMMDKISLLREKLNSLDTQDTIYYLEEPYDSFLVYRVERRVGGSSLYRQNYEIDNSGIVNFVGDPKLVEVKYVEVTNNSSKFWRANKGGKMENCAPCVKEKVDALIANALTSYEEADREWLEKLSVENLDKMISSQVNNNSQKQEATVKLTRDQVFEVMSADDRAIFDFGNKQIQARREKFIKGIQSNTQKDLWSEKELKEMGDDKLEKLYKSVISEEETEIVDYSVNSARTVNTNSNEIQPMILPE